MSRALRIVALYLVAATAWIIISDQLVFDSVNPLVLTNLSVAKGLLFVVVSAVALYIILTIEFRKGMQREQTIAKGEQQFRHLFTQNPVPMYIYDPGSLAILAVNDAAVVTYGYSRSEFLAMRLPDLRPQEDVARLLNMLASEQHYLKPDGIWRHIYKNGDIHYVEVIGNQVEYEGRRGVLVAVHDVSQSYQLQQQLMTVNQRLQFIIDESPIGIVATDRDATVTLWNRAASQVLGWTPEEAIGNRLDYVPPEQREEAAVLRDRILGGETLPSLELIRQRKDGTRVDLRAAIAPMMSLEGEITGQFVLLQDVTQDKKALQQIRELAAIVQASDDAIIGKTLDGTIRSWNAGAQKLYGYSADEMVGQSVNLLVPPDLEDELHWLVETVRHGTSVHQLETQRRRKDGQIVTVSLSVFPIMEEGKPVAAAAIARDMTERRRVQEQLAYQASLLQNVSDAIIALDTEWNILTWNRGAEQIYGWGADEVLGKPVAILQAEYFNQTSDDVLQEFLRTGHVVSESIHRRKDGTPVRIMNSTTALRNNDGTLSGAVGINRDVTRQRELETQARESERLRDELQREIEARTLRNRFLSMVSHEFRTPLSVIRSASDVLFYYDERLSKDDRVKHLGQIQHQVNELTELLNEFLILSRMESVGIQFEPEETDVVTLCEDIVASAQTSFPTHPFDLVGEGPFRAAQVDRKLFQQAVRNVVSNAAKYSPDGTPITLSVHCSEDELIVKITDRGIGIPQEEQIRLFEPFFRASNVGEIEGTGLGLAIVQRAVEAHRGRIQVESTVGIGSEVKFIFPRFVLDKTG